MLQSEIALMLIALGLYVYDSALLLFGNEATLSPARKGRWVAGFGTDQVRIGGKELLVPNPLLPHRPLFRLSWHPHPAPRQAGTGWSESVGSYVPVAVLVWGMAVGLFLLLPLGFFTRLGEKALVAGVLVLYLSIAAALIWVAANRRAFGLSGRKVLGLAFECLLCSPFALNLVRKLSLGATVEEDFFSAAQRLQTPADWLETRRELVSRLDEEIQDGNDETLEALKNYRQVLVNEVAPCPPPK